MPHVVVLGGGFGGLAAVHTLRARLGDGVDITLVDRGDRFFMGFAKLWDLAGIRPLEEGSARLSGLTARGVRLVQAEVTAMEPRARRVETSAGALHADALLVALGAPSRREHVELLSGPGAHDLYDHASLGAIGRSLNEVDAGRVLVAILGGPFKCPPAPFEAVLLVDELLRRRGVRDRVHLAISTFQPVTLPVAGPDASSYVAGHLEERGIELLAGRSVVSVDGADRVVRFEDGSDAPYDVLLGVPACAPPPAVRESALAGPSGWIEPDRHTLRASFEGVYAVGDCTLVPTAKGQLPKAGVFAAGEGEVAAANIAADLGGGPGATFDGHGFCFLELPGRRVAFVEGNFFADPEPDVQLSEADEERFARKQAYERERLAAWLG
ncbi:MAG TPA: FAD/NAD(P)-binding oxidoreductase [Acidimicrobiales bacterium]|nr:FAD/NAD(P)-binding oxidoreductase [Acidimicrobiales bacterium]